MRKKLNSKQLEDGSTINVKSWVSDTLQEDARVFYQLELLESDGIVTNFPEDYENYSGRRIQTIYGFISRTEDFFRNMEVVAR